MARALRREHPRIAVGVTVASALAVVLPVGGAIWFVNGLRKGLPDLATPSPQIGEMDQATTRLRRARISWPSRSSRSSGSKCRSSEVSPHLIQAPDRDRRSAVLRPPRLRPRPHRLGGAGQHPASARSAGRQHHHPAAGASELSDARQDDPPQASGADPRRAHRAACTRRTQILELYLNKVYFGDGLYGVEAASRGYFGKHASELDVAGGGAARRPGEVAVELRADGQPASARSRAATSCCRRCSKRAPSTGRAVAGGARREGRRCATASGPTSRTGSTSRSRSGASSSSGSAGSASTRAACASSRPSTCRCSRPPKRRSPNRLKSIEDAAPPGRLAGAAKTRRRTRQPRRPTRTDALQARAHRAGSGHRPRPRDGRRPRLRREPLQPRGAGAPPAGLGVQAVRLRRRARSGLHAGDGDRSPRRSDRDAAGRVDAGGRAFVRRRR